MYSILLKTWLTLKFIPSLFQLGEFYNLRFLLQKAFYSQICFSYYENTFNYDCYSHKQELAEEIGIECMPTIMFFKNCEKVKLTFVSIFV